MLACQFGGSKQSIPCKSCKLVDCIYVGLWICSQSKEPLASTESCSGMFGSKQIDCVKTFIGGKIPAFSNAWDNLTSWETSQQSNQVVNSESLFYSWESEDNSTIELVTKVHKLSEQCFGKFLHCRLACKPFHVWTLWTSEENWPKHSFPIIRQPCQARNTESEKNLENNLN